MKSIYAADEGNIYITVEDIIEYTDSTQEDIRTAELDGCSIEHPFYYNHKRATNWFAKLTGKNAANMNREFLRMTDDVADLSWLKAGDVVEIGSNYTSSSGKSKDRTRTYYFIISINDDEIVYQAFRSPALAFKQRNIIFKALH